MLPSRILFDDFFDDIHPAKMQNAMSCDIYEEDDTYHIEIDAPGFRKENITIECDEGNLKIIAEKHNDEKNNKKYVHRERRSYEKCERSFYLGNVDEDNIKAEFKDGILNIIVPKKEEKVTKKTIAID